MAEIAAHLRTTIGSRYPVIAVSDEEIAAERAEAAQREHERRQRLSRIPERYRAASLAQCPEFAERYVEAVRGRDKGPWLIISGPNGTGKTFTACAIGNELMDERTVRFSTMSEIIRADWATKSIKDYTNPGLLIIDDFGKEKPTEYSVSKFFEIIDGRDSRVRPTIVTTNYGRQAMAEYLTVNGNDEYAKAILSRLLAKGNHKATMKGDDRRR